MNLPRRSLTYRAVMALASPIVRIWGRLTVRGADHLLRPGAMLLVANHDSHWDPIVLGVAAGRRQLHALAKASLWKNPVLARILDGMGQIPIERGRADFEALTAAITALRGGACVGLFPEGTISRGAPTRVHSGAGRLALSDPAPRVVCARATGVVDIVRFPKRPRLCVEFFEPAGGQPAPGESAISFTKRIMAEIRDGAPYAVPRRRPTAAAYRRLAADSSRTES